MTRITRIALISFIGFGLAGGLGTLKVMPVHAASDAAADTATYSFTDASTTAERDAIRDAKRDAIRDLVRDAARDAAREQSPAQAATILTQTYRQLLLRPEQSTDQIRYGSQLMRGEKSVKAIVGQIARSPEFKEKWSGSTMGAAPTATASSSSTDTTVDNVYCALLGRHVASTPVETARGGAAAGGFEGLVTSILASKEYAMKFGEQGVPQPSLDQRESSGCPQVG